MSTTTTIMTTKKLPLSLALEADAMALPSEIRIEPSLSWERFRKREAMLAEADHSTLPVPPNFPHHVISHPSVWSVDQKLNLEDISLALSQAEIEEVEQAMAAFEGKRQQAEH